MQQRRLVDVKPVDLLAHVVRFLDLRDHFRAAAACKLLRAIACLPHSFPTDLVVTQQALPKLIACRVKPVSLLLSASPGVHSPSIWLEQDCMDWLHACSGSLVRLSINRIDNGLQAVLSLPESTPLEYLDIGGCPAVQEDVYTRFPTLQTLATRSCPPKGVMLPTNITNLHLCSYIANLDFLSKATQLTSLMLEDASHLQNSDFRILVACSSLTNLYVSECTHMIKAHDANLGALPLPLTSLYLRGCTALGSWVFLERLTGLQSLALVDADFGDDHFHHLPKSLTDLSIADSIEGNNLWQLEALPLLRTLMVRLDNPSPNLMFLPLLLSLHELELQIDILTVSDLVPLLRIPTLVTFRLTYFWQDPEVAFEHYLDEVEALLAPFRDRPGRVLTVSREY